MNAFAARAIWTTLLRQCAGAAAWVAPSAGLVLMPKCPLCFAAYVAMATGLGLTATAAGYVRWGVLALCVVSLLVLVVRRVRSWRRPACARCRAEQRRTP